MTFIEAARAPKSPTSLPIPFIERLSTLEPGQRFSLLRGRGNLYIVVSAAREDGRVEIEPASGVMVEHGLAHVARDWWKGSLKAMVVRDV